MTIKLYRYLLRCHLAPTFGPKAIAEIREGNVRTWRKKLLDNGVSEVTTAKAYRLLKAILNTAADDGLIRRNPCRIKGAATEESPEPPVLTIAQVYTLADAIDQRYQAFVLLATFACLRWAELAGLRRCDIDLANLTLSIAHQLTGTDDGKPTFSAPKSNAGIRMVSFPRVIVPELREPPRTDGPHGPLDHQGRAHLPALRRRAPAHHRRPDRQARPHRAPHDQEASQAPDSIWHGSGTPTRASILTTTG